MTQFFDTEGVSYRLREIIKDAEERLVLISPYLKVNDRLKELLEDKDRMKIDVRVIYGKNELQPEENNWLESMTSIRTSFCKNLHAKCYLNENEALLTSMNLYEFSQVNNYEMGLLVSRGEEPGLYDEIYKEAMRIVRASEEIRVTVSRVEAAEGDRRKVSVPKGGFCIRCRRDDLPAAPTKPYCSDCYGIWKRFGNKNFKEKYCHTCGEEHSTTLLKPLCPKCYRKYKDILEFPEP